MPVISAFGRPRQEALELEVSLGCRVRLFQQTIQAIKRKVSKLKSDMIEQRTKPKKTWM